MHEAIRRETAAVRVPAGLEEYYGDHEEEGAGPKVGGKGNKAGVAAETTASQHQIQGPAGSSNAWPLDGDFVRFRRTYPNEGDNYMHGAIRHEATAVWAPSDLEEYGDHEEEGAGPKVGGKRKAGGAAATATATVSDRGDRIKAVRATLNSTASSQAALFPRVDKALRQPPEGTKCNPIDLATLNGRENECLPLPNPTPTRPHVSPVAEFLLPPQPAAGDHQVTAGAQSATPDGASVFPH